MRDRTRPRPKRGGQHHAAVSQNALWTGYRRFAGNLRQTGPGSREVPGHSQEAPAQAGGSSWRDEEQSRRGRFADGSVNPGNTIQMCSRCVMIVKKALSDRARSCPRCGPVLDRDQNRGTPSSFSVC
ncbi:MAG: zinc ribbon domain-containing protein [Candidatus Methanoculleus thermohydrogenotrophicum]